MANQFLTPDELTKDILKILDDASEGLSAKEKKKFKRNCLDWLSAKTFYGH